jgi:hypothetical protein
MLLSSEFLSTDAVLADGIYPPLIGVGVVRSNEQMTDHFVVANEYVGYLVILVISTDRSVAGISVTAQGKSNNRATSIDFALGLSRAKGFVEVLGRSIDFYGAVHEKWDHVFECQAVIQGMLCKRTATYL